MSNGYLTSCALVISILITLMLFSKKSLNNTETKIFKKMLLINILESLSTTLIVVVALTNNSILLFKLLNRIDIILIISWCSLMFYYIYTISTEKNNSKVSSFIGVVNAIFYLFVLFLDVEIINHDGILNSTGPLTYLGLGGALFYVILMILVFLFLDKEKRKLNRSKYIPLYLLIFLLIVLAVLRVVIPEINFISIMFSLVDMIMVFTIENPDLKMLEEFHKAREYANNLNTEKSEFLFNMAGEIKTPIIVINRISKEVLMQDDINVIKSKVNDIKYSSNNLLELVNKVLDINLLEKRKVSVRESKYNTTNLFKGIESQTELKLNNDLVEFRTNYDKSIPNELYGDSVRIRQIINTLIENAIKYTKEGFIELSVNSIVKHDVCRLIITIEDSGVGMTQDVVEHLFDKELEKIEEIDNPKMDLGLVKTLLDLIGGTIIVNSELNHGTKFTIVLDQKVVNTKKNKTIEAVEKYEEMYLNNKKVMCVINDESLSKKINTLFKKYQLDIEIVKLGQSCLEKVRAGEKYDLIIMEEHLEKLSSENTLAKLKSIQGFKTPVVLLTDIKDINEKEEYLKLGFTEIVTLPLKKEQVEELVNNYVQEK